jgi:hypothetical protein
MDWLAWGALVLVATALALQGVLIFDAVYQIVMEKPGFLPFERMLLKRIPTTAEDCLRQGAGKLLVSTGLVIVLLPMLLTTILNASGWQVDIWGRKAIGIVGMACAVLAFYLVVSGATVWRKVRFIHLVRAVKLP